MVKRDKGIESYRGHAYFEALYFEMHFCTGSQNIGGQHLEIFRRPKARITLQLSHAVFDVFKGSVTHWFRDLLNIKQPRKYGYNCWRTHSGETFCHGTREDVGPLFISIPIILILELDDDIAPEWDVPSHLYPGSKRESEEHDLVYDLVGRGLYSQEKSHFIARYKHPEKPGIFTYDGMKNGSHPTQETRAKEKSQLAGKNIQVSGDFETKIIVFHLRGGSKAQDYFFQKQTSAAGHLYNVQFSTQTLHSFPLISYTGTPLLPLEDKERFWMTQPYNSRLAEYVSPMEDIASPSPLANSKSKRKFEVEDSQEDLPQVTKKSKYPIVVHDSPEQIEEDGESEKDPTSESSPSENSDATKHAAWSMDCTSCDHSAGNDVTIACSLCQRIWHIECVKAHIDPNFANIHDHNDTWCCPPCFNLPGGRLDKKL